MTDPANLPRLYGEKEIGRILKRATELQYEEPSGPSADSMTLKELEDVAAEVGIDPAYLRRAALEVDTGAAERSTWAKLAGEELVLVREITVPGELREDGFERIVGVIERGTSEHGQVSLLGRTLTWRAETSKKSRTVQITVTSRDGQTSVRLEENLKKLASEYFGVSGSLGSLLGLAIAGNAGIGLLGLLFPVGILGLTYVGTRALYQAVVRRRRRAMGQLFEQVLNEVGACLVEKALPSGAGDRPPELTAGQP